MKKPVSPVILEDFNLEAAERRLCIEAALRRQHRRRRPTPRHHAPRAQAAHHQARHPVVADGCDGGRAVGVAPARRHRCGSDGVTNRGPATIIAGRHRRTQPRYAERFIFEDDVDGAVISLISALTYTPKGQGYVALLSSNGSLLWEKAGQVGGQVTSVAAGTAQFSSRVFVGGTQRTSENPVRTDGAIWMYHATGDSVFVGQPTKLKAPFTTDEFDTDMENVRSEWVRAAPRRMHPQHRRDGREDKADAVLREGYTARPCRGPHALS